MKTGSCFTLLLVLSACLVADVFDENTTRDLTGNYAIGHVRYSTSGSSDILNAQPLQVASHRGTVSIAHNGNLVNAHELRREMENPWRVDE